MLWQVISRGSYRGSEIRNGMPFEVIPFWKAGGRILRAVSHRRGSMFGRSFIRCAVKPLPPLKTAFDLCSAMSGCQPGCNGNLAHASSCQVEMEPLRVAADGVASRRRAGLVCFTTSLTRLLRGSLFRGWVWGFGEKAKRYECLQQANPVGTNKQFYRLCSRVPFSFCFLPAFDYRAVKVETRV